MLFLEQKICLKRKNNMQKSFSIDTSIYSPDIIQEGISDYAEVCDIILQDSEIVFAGEDESEIEEIFHEFMNYLLSL